MSNFINISTQVGESIPPQTEHAVSVCLPTWEANVGYEEGDAEVVDKLTTGYPRFFIHLYIKYLCSLILTKFSRNELVEKCLIFSSYNVAKRCREYIKVKRLQEGNTDYPIRILQLSSEKPKNVDESKYKQECKVSVVFVHSDDFKWLKEYWQHTGEGISSRVAEYMLKNLFSVDEKTLELVARGETPAVDTDADTNSNTISITTSGNSNSSRLKNINSFNSSSTSVNSTGSTGSTDTNTGVRKLEDRTDRDVSSASYIEERFGRSMDMSMGNVAKKLIKKRIALKVVDVDEESPAGSSSSSALLGQQRLANNNNTQNMASTVSTDNDNTQFTNHVIVVETNSTEQNPNMTSSNLHQNNISPASPTGASHPTDNNGQIVGAASTASGSNNNNNRLTVSHPQTAVDPNRDVYLFPSGMAAIFTAHRLLLELDSIRVRSRMSSSSSSSASSSLVGYGAPYKKTVMFGFPYTDTLSVLRKFNHTHFLPNEKDAMAKLESILQTGEQILAVFTETPSNPLLKMGDILKLRELSMKYGFYIVVDDTIGGFINLDILPHADIVVSSLTKIFSGDSNVLAGSLVLNRNSQLYDFAINQFFPKSYEDLLWCEDAICLERNSRNFVQRSLKVNETTEWLIDTVLKQYEQQASENGSTESSTGGALFEKIYYPKYSSLETKRNYNNVKTANGGYGEVFSLVFFKMSQAKAFFNNLNLCKGPSLGTNFTLSCPYTIIAHYHELEEVAKYGVATALVRISVGLEDPEYLRDTFEFAINKALNA